MPIRQDRARSPEVTGAAAGRLTPHAGPIFPTLPGSLRQEAVGPRTRRPPSGPSAWAGPAQSLEELRADLEPTGTDLRPLLKPLQHMVGALGALPADTFSPLGLEALGYTAEHVKALAALVEHPAGAADPVLSAPREEETDPFISAEELLRVLSIPLPEGGGRTEGGAPSPALASGYDEGSLRVLQGLDPVRRRPKYHLAGEEVPGATLGELRPETHLEAYVRRAMQPPPPSPWADLPFVHEEDASNRLVRLVRWIADQFQETLPLGKHKKTAGS